jgi:hypothetical protein
VKELGDAHFNGRAQRSKIIFAQKLCLRNHGVCESFPTTWNEQDLAGSSLGRSEWTPA